MSPLAPPLIELPTEAGTMPCKPADLPPTRECIDRQPFSSVLENEIAARLITFAKMHDAWIGVPLEFMARWIAADLPRELSERAQIAGRQMIDDEYVVMHRVMDKLRVFATAKLITRFYGEPG